VDQPKLTGVMSRRKKKSLSNHLLSMSSDAALDSSGAQDDAEDLFNFADRKLTKQLKQKKKLEAAGSGAKAGVVL